MLGDSAVGSSRDVIKDFRHGQHDRIDLAAIDANANASGDQAFVFIGSDTFAHFHSLHPAAIGMVRFAGGMLQGNVDSGLAADFEVKLFGATELLAADFVL